MGVDWLHQTSVQLIQRLLLVQLVDMTVGGGFLEIEINIYIDYCSIIPLHCSLTVCIEDMVCPLLFGCLCISKEHCAEMSTALLTKN